MALKPLRPCNEIGCNELTRDRYCETHLHKEKERHKEYDTHTRFNPVNEMYSSFYHTKEWKSLRAFIKKRDKGFCLECKSKNKLKSMDVVDHIVPIRIDWTKRLDPSNCQSLCHSCHNAKTKRDLKLYSNQK